ncbi:cytidylate kinase-like family protein [Lacrimispora sp. 210928-DFI.3.58]|uniref:cytidylate kinase-like family protein n=1 Tax=Lacrimispora sp. 210928-DFI.3.58 TaxID=2883214 RepID=UPI001D078223|nr:cytidylate kinase-like family protein [Lacrimispora sp. 210928-DFI.3.58]MCB7318682.1 cytidylate kinase-like family protein [Lacrimispora sp. 210928-DFI.3.58]
MKDGRKLILTIGRQYGSGGHEVGKQLAEALGLDLYDKNILRMNSNESGIKESYYHMADERAGDKLLYKIVKSMTPENGAPSLGADLVSADNLFRFQSEVIRKLAAAEDCVIIGRCADYVLEGTEGLVRVFIYADMDFRVNRITEKGYYDPKDVKKNIRRIDRERRDYHRYYTGKDWENVENYDLMINTAAMGIDGAVETVKAYLRIKGYEV